MSRKLFRFHLLTWIVALTSLGMLFLAPAQSGANPQNPAPAPSPTSGVVILRPSANNAGRAASQTVPSVQVMVPANELLVVATTQAINSYSSKVGEKIRYVVTQDFIVDSYLIAKTGDIAEGQVQEGQAGNAGGPYGIGYKAANLRVSVDKVYTYCGDVLEVDFDRSEYRRRQGFLGGHQDVEIIKGQKYVPFVAHPQKICATPTTQASSSIPDDALRTATH